MHPVDRFFFIIGMAAHLALYAAACIAAVVLVAWQWFFGDKFSALLIVAGSSLALPLMAPSQQKLETLNYLIKNPDKS